MFYVTLYVHVLCYMYISFGIQMVCVCLAHRLGTLYRHKCENLHLLPNPGGFGSNLTQNISLNTTEFFIRALTYVLLQIQIVQSSEWAKLMTIYSIAQRSETHGILAGIHL